jgi:hypothetical protein
MNQTKSRLLTVLLLLLASGLCYVLLSTENTPRAQGQEGAKGGPAIICSSNFSFGRLLLVDDDAKNISMYKMNEKGLRLMCNRNYSLDLQVEDTAAKPNPFWNGEGSLEFVRKFNGEAPKIGNPK